MRSGPLRNLVEIQAPTAVRQASGQEAKTWATVATVYGELRTVSGREYVVSEQTRAQRTHQVRLRYIAGLLPTHRLKLGSRIFEIVAIDDVANRGRELLIEAKEKVRP